MRRLLPPTAPPALLSLHNSPTQLLVTPSPRPAVTTPTFSSCAFFTRFPPVSNYPQIREQRSKLPSTPTIKRRRGIEKRGMRAFARQRKPSGRQNPPPIR